MVHRTLTTALGQGDRLKAFYAGAAFEIGLAAVAMAIAALFPIPSGGEATISWTLSPSALAQASLPLPTARGALQSEDRPSARCARARAC